METNDEKIKPQVGVLKKRRVVMADGKRYLIYYTFENESEPSEKSEMTSQTGASENV